MSQGSRATSSELDHGVGQGLQPQVNEQGLCTNYARLERGLDRKIAQTAPLTQDPMGTSQQLSTSLRKAGEAGELPLSRELLTPRGTSIRHVSNAGGGVPPVLPASGAARTASRPPSSALSHLISPRQQPTGTSNPSYRDAALLAAQHGLSPYAPSAAASASRTHTPRSGAKGRPPPAPRPLQHSAPSPSPFQPLNGASGDTGPLPSCSGASPSPRRSGMPASRGGLLPSRGSAPTPNFAHRSTDAAPVTSHRASDVATVTVTYNDALWREQPPQPQSQHQPDDGPGPGASASSLLATHPLGPTTSTLRVMSPGWGTAAPSVFEADGRPGTRGGGPQYDMEGRPTTRGGQRPPSRAQLNMGMPHPRLPSHVAPLVLGPGWAGLFAGGSGTGPGESSTPTCTSPRAPSAGASVTSWSGEAAEPLVNPNRRQVLPLPPSMSGVPANGSGGGGGSLGVGAPPGSAGGGTGASRGAGILSPLGASQPVGALGGQLPSTHLPAAAAAAGGGGGGVTGSIPGSIKSAFASKLSSIAEVPASPVVSLKSLLGSSSGGGASGRKGLLSREAGPAATAGEHRRPTGASSNDDMSEEGIHDDSYLSNLDQDCSNRNSGRTRPRSTPLSSQNDCLCRQSSGRSDGGPPAGGSSSAGPSSPTHEVPAIRPRR